MIDQLERQLETQQVRAHGLAADLTALEWQDRCRRVRTDDRYHTPAFVELAMNLARERGRDPQDARRWAWLAVEATERSLSDRTAELAALAWAVLGNHHRCCSELFRAAAAFARSRALRSSIADPLDLAECLSLEASYWREMRHFQAAERCLRSAKEIVERFGAPLLRARIEVKLGQMLVDAASWTRALHHLWRGLHCAEEAGDDFLILCAAHNSAAALVELGVYDWACAMLCELEPLYESHGTRRQKLQKRWLVARCALGRGNLAEAGARLRQVRDQLIHEQDTYLASLVELDLVEVYASQGDWPVAETSASAAAAGLRAVGATAEALVALEVLRDGLAQRLQLEALRSLLKEARTEARGCPGQRQR